MNDSRVTKLTDRRQLMVIFNPTAGRRRGRAMAQVMRLLEGQVDITQRRTAARGDAEAFARETPLGAIALVAGGDGTANEVANGLLAAGGGEMAILPLGTANVLAAELGIFNLAGAAGAAARGPLLTCRPGLANGRGFLLMAGAGFDAHVVANVSPKLKRLLGKGAYVVETLRQLARFAFPRYRVTVDGVVHDVASVIVARGHFYGGRFIVAPEARLESDELHVCLFERWGRRQTLRFGLALLLGRLPHTAGFRVIAGRQIKVSVLCDAGERRRQPVQIDGDDALTLPVSINLASAAVRLLQPA